MTRFKYVAAHATVVAAALLSCLGCKSDLSQQLLERELRMQEDQIYQLQDELQDKSTRLDRVAGENSSLKRQLGFNENDAPAPRRGPSLLGGPSTPSPAIRPGPSQPLLVPPAIDIPGTRPPAGVPAAPPAAGPSAPEVIAPPKLEGIPALPAEPKFPGAATPGASSVMPASATIAAGGDPADATSDPPTGRRISHEESLADAGRITHLVVNPSRTACFDGDGDGGSDGLAIVIEPRDGDERLVTAAGDVSISVFEPGAPTGAGPAARWDIAAPEAIGHFRRTSRNRGLHFVLRWPGPPPRGDHVRVQVTLTTFEAATFQTDCTVSVKPQLQSSEAP
jgi:hypothetical protein